MDCERTSCTLVPNVRAFWQQLLRPDRYREAFRCRVPSYGRKDVPLVSKSSYCEILAAVRDTLDKTEPDDAGLFGTREQEADGLLDAVIMLEVCRRHEIAPFWGLEFDYLVRGNDGPKLNYLGPKCRLVHDEPYASCVSPARFARFRYWYRVDLNRFSGAFVVRMADSLRAFVQSGYSVLELDAGLLVDGRKCVVQAVDGYLTILKGELSDERVAKWDSGT